MTGKDIKRGTVIGNRRVLEVFGRKGRWMLYSYEYLVSEKDGSTRWYRQSIPPVGKIAVNKRVAG
jgi:hypothetical protein